MSYLSPFPSSKLSSIYFNIESNFESLSSSIKSLPYPSHRNKIFPLLDNLLDSIKDSKEKTAFYIEKIIDENEQKLEDERKSKLDLRKESEQLEKNYQNEKEIWKVEVKKVAKIEEILKENEQNNIKKLEESRAKMKKEFQENEQNINKWKKEIAEIKIKEEKERYEQRMEIEKFKEDLQKAETKKKNAIKKLEEGINKIEHLEKTLEFTKKNLEETETNFKKENRMRIEGDKKIDELERIIELDEILRNPPFPEFLGEKLLKPTKKNEIKNEQINLSSEEGRNHNEEKILNEQNKTREKDQLKFPDVDEASKIESICPKNKENKLEQMIKIYPFDLKTAFAPTETSNIVENNNIPEKIKGNCFLLN